ncbi:MAG: protein kinase [Sedimentisphaerales bacterium]|nr:protein kinase [Sedimentisphaerales bacterium]
MAALLDGAASPEQLTYWRRHLRLCDSCAASVARLRAGLEATAPWSMQADGKSPGSGGSRLLVGLEPNLQLGDFRLERRLGSGGMGVVYQAMQISLNRPVALKVLPSGLGRDVSAVERFHREARAAAKLRHRNIVTIYAEGIENTVCYFAMELIEGRPLDQLIAELRMVRKASAEPNHAAPAQTPCVDRPECSISTPEIPDVLADCRCGRVYFDTVARLISEVADALQYAHERGIVHRDVKPSNLMLARDGRLILLDFGIARVCQEGGMTMTGSFVGTPRYMSPEQVSSECRAVGQACDIYSLGVTLYELLTLEPLFDGRTRDQVIAQILSKEPLRPRLIDRRIPADLETICLKAIEKEPGRRYTTAGEFAEDLRRYLDGHVIKARPPGMGDRLVKLVRRRKVATALVMGIVVTLAFAGSIAWKHYTTRWAQQDAMVLIDELVERNEYFAAMAVAEKAARYLPDDPLLEIRWPSLSREYNVETDPPGADVYIGEYSAAASKWKYLGRAPLRDVRVPFGPCRWRVEKPGFVPTEGVRTNELSTAQAASGRPSGGFLRFTLQPIGQCPPDMVCVGPAQLDQKMLFHGERTVPSAPAFLIDRREVTNRQFRDFVVRGGYESPEFWEHEFIENGKAISWPEAMKRFHDQTGQPGPATWKRGTYLRGQGDYPVGGISWYEAAAYARFRDKHLPTIFHWTLAARADDVPSQITRLSNFSDDPARVGRYRGMGKHGLYDAAGNAREWCFNAIEGQPETRCLLGGAWGEDDYAFVNGSTRSPWDRDEANGLRCVRYLPDRSAVPALAFAAVEHRVRDFAHFTPVSEEVLNSYIDTWYRYDRTPLNACIETVDRELVYSLRERVTFDAAYPNERVIAYLHLPKEVDPPYQVVIWYPGDEARSSPWDKRAYRHELVSLIRSGRAVVVPFYKGTYERRLEQESYPPDGVLSRNLYVQRSQDLRRTVDYLETRGDIDTDKLAYVGLNWGAQMGPLMIATEERFKTGILLCGGICACARHPTSDPANFAPHVTIPMLMINTRDDSIFPYETAQKPLFDLLGTCPAEKKHLLFPGGQGIPWEYRLQYHADMAAWLDQHLGPVRRPSLVPRRASLGPADGALQPDDERRL